MKTREDTAVRERPIIFSGPMVRAIIDGRKTQTRRVVKSPVKIRRACDVRWLEGSEYPEVYGAGGVWLSMPCPYGRIGDVLWVRETWCEIDGEMFYQATFDPETQDTGGEPWRPSIHMPRIVSRLTLEIESVRMQRIQEIREADAQAEGFRRLSTRAGFMELWDSLNGKRAPWSSNPFVWVIAFKVILTTVSGRAAPDQPRRVSGDAP